MSFSLSPGLSKVAALGAVLDRRDGPLAAVMEMVALAADSGATHLTIVFGPKDVSATFDGQLAQPGAGQDRRGWMPVQVYHLSDRPILAGNGWGAVLEAGAEAFPIHLTAPREDVKLWLPYRIQASPLADALNVAPLNGDILQRLMGALFGELRRGMFFASSLKAVQVVLNGQATLRVRREEAEWEMLDDGLRRRAVSFHAQSQHGESRHHYTEYVGTPEAFRVLVPAPEAPAHEAWEDAGLFGRGAGRWPGPVPVACRGPFELSRAGYALSTDAIAHDLATLGVLLARAVAHERGRAIERWLPLWAPEPGADPSHGLAPLLAGFWSVMPSLETLPDAVGGWWYAEGAPLTRAVGCPAESGDLHPSFEECFPRFSRRFPVRLPVILTPSPAEATLPALVETSIEALADAPVEPPPAQEASETNAPEAVAPLPVIEPAPQAEPDEADASTGLPSVAHIVEHIYGLDGGMVIGDDPVPAPAAETAPAAPLPTQPAAPPPSEGPGGTPEDRCPIELLRLLPKAELALRRAGIHTVGQLRSMSLTELSALRGLSEHGVSAVLRAAATFEFTDDDPLALIPVQALPLSRRSLNALVRVKILTLKALLAKQEQGLSSIPGLGAQCVAEIQQALDTFLSDTQLTATR